MQIELGHSPSQRGSRQAPGVDVWFQPSVLKGFRLLWHKDGAFAGFGGVTGWQELVLGVLHVAALRKWTHSTR